MRVLGKMRGVFVCARVYVCSMKTMEHSKSLICAHVSVNRCLFYCDWCVHVLITRFSSPLEM